MDWPPPRFCEVGDEWCQCRRRKAVASRVAGDVARDAARGRRTAGNHFPRGSRFFRGVPEKADRMDAPRTRGNDRGERDSRRSSAWIAEQGREVAGDGARSPVAVPEASALPRVVPWASSPNSCGCSDGIDFTERVRSGYPGSAHRRARTRPSGDVRGETASATTLDARGRRSRGAGFDPRVTPNAMTSPREPLHFSSRFNQVDPTQRARYRRVWAFSHDARVFVRRFELACTSWCSVRAISLARVENWLATDQRFARGPMTRRGDPNLMHPSQIDSGRPRKTGSRVPCENREASDF